MPNRRRAPRIHPVQKLTIPPVEEYRLDNGLPVYAVNMGTQEVIRLDLIFHGGRPHEHKPMVARATIAQIREGSPRVSGAYLADRLDYFGSSLSTPAQLDFSQLTVHCMNKYLPQVLPLITDILTDPAFPEEELVSYIRRNLQRLQVELSKTDVVAYRAITEQLYGSHHPYGWNSTTEIYQALQRDDLVRHYHSWMHAGNAQCFVAGQVTADTLAQLNASLGQDLPARPAPPPTVLPPYEPGERRVSIERQDSLQTSIRIGRPMFSRHHPDYHGLSVLNTILGGYFGSRLMTNIREEKGYTYNIYSTLDTMRFDGCFYIAAEVGNTYVEDTRKQIYEEIDRLQQDLVDEEELEMVRSYILGTYLTTLDGPFNVGDLVRSLISEGLTLDFFREAVDVVREIDATQIRDLAQLYLRPEDMYETLVGARG
ncbi:MAG: insulinase family protein [Lewinellaceae bacterium]|nr:insulinase family protein [Lewinellaceae bacterium]